MNSGKQTLARVAAKCNWITVESDGTGLAKMTIEDSETEQFAIGKSFSVTSKNIDSINVFEIGKKYQIDISASE